jgi:hypothetical protein
VVPCPRGVASSAAEEILSVDHVGDRELLKVDTSSGKRRSDPRIYNAIHFHLLLLPGRKLASLEYPRQALAEIFKDRHSLETLWKVFLYQLEKVCKTEILVKCAK